MKKKNNSSNGLFVQRMFAFVFDVVIVSFVVSFICMPFIDYESPFHRQNYKIYQKAKYILSVKLS